MKTPKNLEAESAAKGDLARLEAELEAAVRERDEHRTATLFMLEDLEENRKRIERAHQEWVRVFDAVRDPIFVHDREFRIVRSNRAYAERAGMPIQEVIGKPYWEVFPKRDGPLPGCYALEKAEEEKEEEVRVDSGELFLSRSFLVHDAAGAFLFAVHIMEDITERKRAEQLLRESEEKFRTLVETTSDWIWEVDKAGVYTYCSPRVMDMLGYAPEELIGKSPFDFMPSDEAARVGKLYAPIVAAKKPFTALENANLHRDGRRVVIETSGVPVRDAKGDLLGYRGVDRDITQRKEHEARIEHLNRLIRSARNINRLLTSEKDRGKLLQHACDVLVRGADYRMVWIGATEQGHKRMVPVAQAGFTEGYLDSIAITWDEAPTGQGPTGTAIRTGERLIIQDVESDPRYALWREAALKRGYRSSATFPLISNNYTYGVLNFYADKPNTFDAEEIALLDEVADDIAFALYGMHVENDRKRSEEALRDSEEQLRTISSSAQDGIVMADNDGTIEFWNPSAERLFGYTAEEAIGKPLHDLIVPERLREKARPGFEKFRATGQGPIIGKVLELPSLRKDGIEFVAEHSISAVSLRGKWHAVAVVRDITERKQGEDRLRKSAAELKEAQRVAQLGNWELHTETGNVTWSEELYRIFGRDPALPAPGYEEHPRMLAPESYARMNAAIEKTRQTGEPYELDLELVRPDGMRKWITARGEAKRDFHGQIVGLRGTSLDITERKQAEMDRQQYAERLGRSLEETIRAVALTVEMRDPYTAGHQRRVAELTVAIATELGLPKEQVHGLYLASIIHDLGKIHIPAEILSKPGKLTDIEFSFIKTHPQAGYDILKDVEFPWPIAQIVLQHHERLDGRGYPQGLKAEQILLEARILAVADVIEAMASHRPYRPALGLDAALNEIAKNRGTQFEPVVADACVRLFREKGFAFA
jgi:PAS domain S-box-containing protein